MWVVKVFLFLVLLFVLVYFFLDNSGQTVDIKFFGRDYLDLKIFWVILIAFLLGFATYFVIASVREFRFHSQIRRLRNEARAKDEEITQLRTLPLQDLGADEQMEGSDLE